MAAVTGFIPSAPGCILHPGYSQQLMIAFALVAQRPQEGGTVSMVREDERMRAAALVNRRVLDSSCCNISDRSGRGWSGGGGAHLGTLQVLGGGSGPPKSLRHLLGGGSGPPKSIRHDR